MRERSNPLRFALGIAILLIMFGSIGLAVWHGKPVAPNYSEAWVVYSCGELDLVLFVDQKGELKELPFTTPEAKEKILSELDRVPELRRYYISVKRHCPYYLNRG